MTCFESQSDLETFARGDGLLHMTLAGSFAYGTNHAHSDQDFRGIYAPPESLEINPFSPLKTGVVSIPEEEDMLIFSLREFFRDIDKRPENLDVLFAPRDCYQMAPASCLKTLFENRDVFLSQRTVMSLMGHAWRNLKVARKNPDFQVSDCPRHSDFFYLDQGFTTPLPKYLYATDHRLVKVDRATFNVHSSPNGRLFHNGMIPANLKQPSPGALVKTIYFDSESFRNANRAYKDRCSAPVRHNAKAKKARQFGFDTKTAAHALRCARMALEVATESLFQVRRPDAQELLDIQQNASRSLDDIWAEVGKIQESVNYHLDENPAVSREPNWHAMSSVFDQIMVDLRDSQFLSGEN